MRKIYARRVFVRSVETDTFYTLAVNKATHEYHHDRQKDEDEEYRRADTHPLTEGVVIGSVAIVSLVPRDGGVGGCGQRSGEFGGWRRGGGRRYGGRVSQTCMKEAILGVNEQPL